jgi:hypothetical protein
MLSKSIEVLPSPSLYIKKAPNSEADGGFMLL